VIKWPYPLGRKYTQSTRARDKTERVFCAHTTHTFSLCVLSARAFLRNEDVEPPRGRFEATHFVPNHIQHTRRRENTHFFFFFFAFFFVLVVVVVVVDKIIITVVDDEKRRRRLEQQQQ